MKVAIMQPYFMPYIGYFQLISAVDKFVIYDDIKYTKKGWINRNRFLFDGEAKVFSLPLQSASDKLDICKRCIASDFDRTKLLNRIAEAYRRSPHFDGVFPLIKAMIERTESNLFNFLLFTLSETCKYLGIRTPLVVSSSLAINRDYAGEARVIATCKHLGAKTYINAIGGQELYSQDAFSHQGIDLRFLQPKFIEYPQFDAPFIPWLSIIDVMMFNSPKEISQHLRKFILI